MLSHSLRQRRPVALAFALLSLVACQSTEGRRYAQSQGSLQSCTTTPTATCVFEAALVAARMTDPSPAWTVFQAVEHAADARDYRNAKGAVQLLPLGSDTFGQDNAMIYVAAAALRAGDVDEFRSLAKAFKPWQVIDAYEKAIRKLIRAGDVRRSIELTLETGKDDKPVVGIHQTKLLSEIILRHWKVLASEDWTRIRMTAQKEACLKCYEEWAQVAVATAILKESGANKAVSNAINGLKASQSLLASSLSRTAVFLDIVEEQKSRDIFLSEALAQDRRFVDLGRGGTFTSTMEGLAGRPRKELLDRVVGEYTAQMKGQTNNRSYSTGMFGLAGALSDGGAYEEAYYVLSRPGVSWETWAEGVELMLTKARANGDVAAAQSIFKRALQATSELTAPGRGWVNARLLAGAGSVAGADAKHVADDAVALTQNAKIITRGEAFDNIARGLAAAGATGDALSVYRRLMANRYADGVTINPAAGKDIARALAASGRTSEAVRFAQDLDRPSIRALAYLGIYDTLSGTAKQ